MRVKTALAASFVLAAVLVAGSTATSAADASASDPAPVVHWSGIAVTAISAGPRSPASSSVLGGMAHGAIYDAVAAVEGGLDPFATGVTAPPGASVEAAVAQAARDVLVTRVPGQAFERRVQDHPPSGGGDGIRQRRHGRVRV